MGVHRRISCAALVLCVCLASGCSPTPWPSSWPTASGSGSKTSSPGGSSPVPTPTTTLNANQSAAIVTLEGYARIASEIGADPSAFSEAEMIKAFSKYVGGDMIRANVDSRMHLKTKKYRMLGSTKFTSIDVGRDRDTGDARGTEVILTACQDQTELKIVDRSGSVVTDEQKDIPSFLLRQYTVLKTQGSAQWRIYGMETVKGACG